MKLVNLCSRLLVVATLGAIGYVSLRTRGGATSNAAEITRGSQDAVGTLARIDWLKAYWGPKWPSLEKQLSDEQRATLTQRMRPEDVPPWEVVAPVMREKLRNSLQSQRQGWDQKFVEKGELDPTSDVLNPQHKAMSVASLVAFHEVVDRFAGDIEALVQQSFDLAVEIDEQVWNEGLYQQYPLVEFVSQTPPSSSGHFVLVRKWVQDPWIVEYTIDSSKRIEFESVLKSINELRRRRVQAMREYIGGL